MRLVRLEPGTFLMGVGKTPLPDEVVGKPHRRYGDFDERPMHKVRLARPFYMGVCEVTNTQRDCPTALTRPVSKLTRWGVLTEISRSRAAAKHSTEIYYLLTDFPVHARRTAWARFQKTGAG